MEKEKIEKDPHIEKKPKDQLNVVSKKMPTAILVGVSKGEDITYSMEELEGLAEAASVEVVGIVTQNLDKINRATFIGKGKVEEIKEMCANMEVETVIFNEELSGIQLRNLEEVIEVRVIDRTILILDIFASRATSKEGKLQVELAQLQYRMPRLLGFGKSLSRLGGGIGTRGPGEKKLESDRRHIQKRLDDIKKEIDKSKQVRQTQRGRREKNQVPLVAIVGYTNSGKSALMNKILEFTDHEEKSVVAKDMLFATLDTQQRSINLEDNREFVLIDTVGFVSKLPHTLVDAFKSTLEEVSFADLVIHLVDASFENSEFHVDTTEKVLKEIGAGGKEKLLVYNKIDLLDSKEKEELADNGIGEVNLAISAKTGENIPELINLVAEKIFAKEITSQFLVPFERGDIVDFIHQKGKVLDTKHSEEGTLIKAKLLEKEFEMVKKYERK